MKKNLLKAAFSKVVFSVLAFSLAALSSHAQSPVTFTTPGTNNWTVPYGVTSITVETWGAGGAGGGSAGFGGGGGGGGGYNTITMSVSYGDIYSYTVGAGSAGTVSTGIAGGSSSFNSGTIAIGGDGGVAGTSSVYGTGGAGGTGSKSGGTGGTATSSGSGGGGGSAGNGSAGGNGGVVTAGTAGTAGSGTAGAAGGVGISSNNAGSPGTIPGGGGGGGKSNGKKGGAGANGQVKISYSQPCTAPPAQPTSLILTSAASTSILGSFTAGTYTDGYLVVRTTTSSAPTNPVNGTTYVAGAAGLGGTIVYAGTLTSFTSSSLTAHTQYWYWVYGYNNTPCTGGVTYLTASPLTTSGYTLCATPSNSPTALTFPTVTYNSISGSFTAGAGADGYLVIQMTSSTAVTLPTNGTAYTVGTSALGGTVVQAGAGTTFTSSGLTGSTGYWYTIFSMDFTTCYGPVYKTTSPLKANTTTSVAPCITPAAQPTSLSFSPVYSESLSASFTASAADGYLVIRTSTSSAPTAPVDGTTYTAGTNALGGYVSYAGTATTFSSATNLTASTTYWYWVYAYNNVSCAVIAYKSASPLSASVTTAAAGTYTNTATLTTPGTSTYNWSALSWSMGHLPTASENAQIILNNAGTAADVVSVNLDVDTTLYSFKMSNTSPGPYVHVFNTVGGVNLKVLHDFTVDAPGGTKYTRCAFANIDSTTIYGNLYLGRATGTAAEGMGAIGSTGNTAGQTYTLYGDMYFYPRGYTTDEHAIFVFDKAGTQHIYNYTLTTDTIEPLLFEDIRVGHVNATTLVFGGTVYDGYMELVGRAGLQIGVNSTMDLPANFSFNVIGGGTPGYLKMLAGSRLRLGGDHSITGSFGVTGSNFTAGFSPYTLDATSTIEYYGSNAITQTIYNGVTYTNLEIVNGSGTGRATKINTGALTVNNSIKIKALADLYLGSTVSSTGPFDVQSTGGLYCGTNVVSGAGAFTLASAGYLGMGHASGITSGTTLTGNIQMTGGRSFSTAGNYIYNGSVSQITGTGLPAICNDLTVDNPTTVTIAATQKVNGINLLAQGVFDIGANNKITISDTGRLISTSGKMKANLSMVEMSGTTGVVQSLDASWFVNRTISSLINSNTTGITLASTANDTLLIASALLYGSGITNSVITTNNNLTLLSRDTSTARFGEIVSGSGNSISGNVNVERYIGNSARKWRHLAWPTNSSQTCLQSWMENNSTPNADANHGYGTIVTDALASWSSNGFDSRSVSGPSVKYYNPSTNNYSPIPNTNSYAMNSQSAYFNFVRGDRACTPANNTVNTTILRTTGTLKTGNQAVTVTASKYAAVGNPYASAIDIRSVDTLNLTSTFQVWDPKLTGAYGLGAYQTLYASGGGYKVMPGGGSYGALNSAADTIESGQAFFVKAQTGLTGTLTVKENAKQLSARTMQRDVDSNIVMPGVYPLLSLSNLGGSELLDGCMANFDPSYSSSVDDWDIPKLTNTSENVSLIRSGQLLSIERRKNITANDTLFINVTGYRVHQYQWDITVDKLDDDPTRTGFLIDQFMGTSSPLNLNGVNSFMFNVDGSTGSVAANRFMIVFKQTSGVLPVRFTSISAVRNTDKTVTVRWKTENEINMQDYTIEHSDDGISFTAIGTQLPATVNGGSAAYSFIDVQATTGNNYYRVRGNSLNGQKQYTAIVKVGPIGKDSPGMSIYPNPVTDGNVNLRFENMPKGNYTVNITNKIGQLLHTETVQADNNNFVRIINPGAKLASGGYQVTVTDESGKMTTIPFLVR